MMEDEDITKTDRVMAALLKMKKLNIAKLKKAYLGK
jgi:predicted 3-demethylubiquinone-9 3-methyltransferase (glyoxalase superfamily)